MAIQERNSEMVDLLSVDFIRKTDTVYLAGIVTGVISALPGLIAFWPMGISLSDSNDIYPDYAYLPGRAGGQTLKGGTAAGDDLTLQSTAHATKGSIIIGTSAYDEVNNRLGLGTVAPDYRLHISGDNSATFAIIKLQNTQTDGRSWWLYSGANGVAENFGIYDQTASSYRMLINASGYAQFIYLGEAWTNATYTSGWEDAFGTYLSVGYKRVGDMVFLRGMAKRTSGVSTTIFTLPSGYRPPKQARLPATSNDAFCSIDINTAGNVIVIGGSPATWVAIDGINFSTL